MRSFTRKIAGLMLSSAVLITCACSAASFASVPALYAAQSEENEAGGVPLQDQDAENEPIREENDPICEETDESCGISEMPDMSETDDVPGITQIPEMPDLTDMADRPEPADMPEITDPEESAADRDDQQDVIPDEDYTGDQQDTQTPERTEDGRPAGSEDPGSDQELSEEMEDSELPVETQSSEMSEQENIAPDPVSTPSPEADRIEPKSEQISEKIPDEKELPEEDVPENEEAKGILWVRVSGQQGTVRITVPEGEYVISSGTGEASAIDPRGEEAVLTVNGWLLLEETAGTQIDITAEADSGYHISTYSFSADPTADADPAPAPETADGQKMLEITVCAEEGEAELEIAFETDDPYYLEDGFDFQQFDSINFTSCRLIAGTSDESIFVNDGSLISGYDGVYLLQFESEETARKAYAYYYNKVDFIEADTGIMVAGDAPGYKPAEISEPITVSVSDAVVPETGETEGWAAESVDTDTFMTESDNPLSELEEVSGILSGSAIDIALIDTGADGADESVSLTGEDPADHNGHGTAMLEYIRQYAPDARVLSVKALGDDGKGDVSAVYAAVRYAVERGAKIINLSVSALAGSDSRVIEMAVNEAVNNGTAVVGSAGNNGSSALYYVPGKIESAYIIGACTGLGKRIDSSNYGSTVDFYMTAGSTSEAAARFSGWLYANGEYAFETGLDQGILFLGNTENTDTDAPYGQADVFDIAGADSEYTYVDLVLPPRYYHDVVTGYSEVGGMQIPVTQRQDLPLADLTASYQNLSGKLYGCNDTSHPTPDTSIYSTGKDYRKISEIKIYDSRFYSFTNDQGVEVIGVNQSDLTRTAAVADTVFKKYGWLLDRQNHTDATAVKPNVFEHPFDIVLHGAAVDMYGKELDLTISFDQVIAVMHGSAASYGIFPGVPYSPLDAGSSSNWWSPLWGRYTTPAAYNGTDFIAGILEHEIWSCAAPLYNPSAPEIQGNQFGGINTVSMSWKYSDGTDFNGTVNYAFTDIDSGQEGFLFIDENQPSDYIGFQESVTLNSGWSGVYKQVPDSDLTLHIINKNASYLCGQEGDNSTFRAGFVGSVDNGAAAKLTWTGTWCGTVIFDYLFTGDKGGIRIEKTSADPAYTKSLAGAVFGIYSSSDCRESSLVETLTTDNEGIAATEALSLPAKTYYIKEISAPAGYAVNAEVFTAKVTAAAVTAVSITETPLAGSIQILKEIDTKGLSAAAVNAVKKNSAYSVAGAQYTIYTDKSCTERFGSAVLTIAADENSAGMTGSSNVVKDVPPGTYYIRETKAGSNLELDKNVYSVTITSSNYSVTQKPSSVSRDAPIFGSVSLTKTSAVPGITEGNRCYSLQGAKYGIYTDSACKNLYVQAVTDIKGKFTVSDMPLGTYYIRELTPSEGFGHAPCADGTAAHLHKAELSSSVRSVSVICEEPVKAVPVKMIVQKKDSDGKNEVPQGDSDLSGAEYTVRYYMNNDWSEGPARTWTLVTDENGCALPEKDYLKSGSSDLYLAPDSSAVIPLGSFTVQETKAPKGYRINDTVYKYRVTDGQAGAGSTVPGIITVSVSEGFDPGKGIAAEEHVIRGGVRFQKADADTKDNVPQGGASLAGAEISIYNLSDNRIFSDGSWHAPENNADADALRKNADPVITVITDSTGCANTPQDALPYGSYAAIETKSPSGYELNKDWIVCFSVREEGAVIETDVLYDRVIRRDFEFLKVNIDGSPKAHTPFLMTLLDDKGSPLESHVFVTDENGWYRSRQHDQHGEVNGLDDNHAEGWYVRNSVHADPLPEDAGTAVWFGAGEAPLSGGALVYGNYRIEELRTLSGSLNGETLQFSHDILSISQPGDDPVFLGVMVDLEITMSTDARAAQTGLKMIPADENVQVEDEITCDHLDSRNEYIFKIDFRDTQTGKSAGMIEHRFKPEKTGENAYTSGTRKFTAAGTIDTSGYEGSGGSVSAYTELYQVCLIGGDKYEMLVRTHNESLDDEEETLYIPSVQTKAMDVLTGDNVGAYAENDGIRDEVTVSGIAQKSRYRLTAKAVDNSDGTELGSSDLEFFTGKGVTSVSRTMPEIMFNSGIPAGGSATVYEYLYYLDEDESGIVTEYLIGSHCREMDPDQTVWYASADTLALSEHGVHAAKGSEHTVIKDTVDLKALVPGREYVLKGILMDADTGEALCDDDGNHICSEVRFTTQEQEMQEVLSFDFPFRETIINRDKPVKAVVYVTLWHNDIPAAVHEELNDEDETVIIVPPEYKKYADDNMTQETAVSEEDRISYRISWSQADYETAEVRLRDTLSEGLTYAEGSARDAEGRSCEPEVSGNVLSWTFKDIPAGSYGTITYDVLVNRKIKTTHLVNNRYEVSAGSNDTWILIESLENPGLPEKEYANDILKQEVPVLSEDTVVFEGKETEYSLVWINPYMTPGTVELRDTLSAGLSYQEGSADMEPSSVTENGDGTTTLYWKIEAAPHEWGKIGYTAVVRSRVLEGKSIYMVNNDYDLKITRQGEDPEASEWQDIRTLRNPVPHYLMEKSRLTKAPVKFFSEGLYGFCRGDAVDYEAVITNDGSTSIVFDISDSFESPEVFEDLKITDIMGKDVEILSREDANARILIRAGAQAKIRYRTLTGMKAREYLASSALDDRTDPEDGYLNTAAAFNARTFYKDAAGNKVVISKNCIEVSQDQNDAQEVSSGNSTVRYDMHVPELEDKADTANTPVQVPMPGFTVTKDRISEASAKKDHEGMYGFKGGERIVYDVTLENTGELDLEMTVSDEFAQEISGYFKDLRIISVSAEELERLNDTQVRIKLAAGRTAVIRYEAFAAEDASELLSPSAADRTRELVRNAKGEDVQALMKDPSFDLLGYLNIAKASQTAAVYETNDGKTVKIHGKDDSEFSGKTQIINPDGTVKVITSADEYIKALADRFDAAHTPVQAAEEPTEAPEPEKPAGPPKPEEPTRTPEPEKPAGPSKPDVPVEPDPAGRSLPVKESAVKTGDDSNAAGWLMIACVALFIIAVLFTVFACTHRDQGKNK